MQLRSWSGKRTDRGASDELIQSKNAARDSGAFVKNLLASAGQELKEVHTMGNALRTFVYNQSLPWSSSDGAKRGERIIATTKAMTFLSELNALKKEYDRAVLALVSVWPQRVAEAMRNLGSLADSADYPTAAQLPSMFSVSVDLKPIPAISDYKRLSVPAELQEALGERHKVSAQVQVQNAMNDLRDRFIEELTRIDRQMSKVAAGEKTRLYDSLVTNMQLLVDMAASMNLTGNPKLQELVARIEQKILAKPVAAYKDDAPAAKVLASDARNLATEAAMEEVWK
jgi:molybdopterin converting factor small subunit